MYVQLRLQISFQAYDKSVRMYTKSGYPIEREFPMRARGMIAIVSTGHFRQSTRALALDHNSR